MQISDKNHALFLDLERFSALENENPKLLGEIIQKRLDMGLSEIYRQRKIEGLPVFYSDESYPGYLVREDADGKCFIVTYDAKNNYQEVVVRQIPRPIQDS